ncbi:serine/threonine-protein phosphatase [Streptomyces sp. NBC_00249]|uniref:PP2C family protein-serine/threonine phosphatase n=1 Tax=Streptomyces sp. NBC_00249 TaxID=2975690 RepID=UPI002254957D|nr:PP2C family protein-serine/threonine phosphatase [Streptomyces sp. NBC_00249]MCX5195489.1 serine/threonine-protein phosphatase [Streptomyces sp. NBC_00249]
MTPRRPSRPGSADLLTMLGQLTAQAREGAEFQQARVELAEALQRELLPSALPVLPGLRSAARYAPARRGLDIGGDWYDGFRVPQGAVAFSIGDVQGHDVAATAFMGQVRVCLRAVASVVVDPGEVLSRANEVLLAMDCELFATCTLLRFDPGTGELASARAGHVPSVWATVDGRYGIAEDTGGLPLGMLPGSAYPVTRRRLTRAGTIVLVTDGVVEGPSFPIDVGLERVVGIVREAAGAEPDELAAEVMKVADSTGHADDAAVLVIGHDAVA